MSPLEMVLYAFLGVLVAAVGAVVGIIACCVLVGIVRTARAHRCKDVAPDEAAFPDGALADEVELAQTVVPPLIFHQMINARHDAVPLSDRDEDAWALILNGYRNEETP